MKSTLRQLVWKRANHACEYCQIPQESDLLPFEIDHVVAQKHHGATSAENLALSCYNCNSYKGSNVAGIDPTTGAITPLFHPRRDAWPDHFSWNGPMLIGLTPVGRTTIDVLKINLPERVEHRRLLIELGVFPPVPNR
jgi:hypothetical protein